MSQLFNSKTKPTQKRCILNFLTPEAEKTVKTGIVHHLRVVLSFPRLKRAQVAIQSHLSAIHMVTVCSVLRKLESDSTQVNQFKMTALVYVHLLIKLSSADSRLVGVIQKNQIKSPNLNS